VQKLFSFILHALLDFRAWIASTVVFDVNLQASTPSIHQIRPEKLWLYCLLARTVIAKEENATTGVYGEGIDEWLPGRPEEVSMRHLKLLLVLLAVVVIVVPSAQGASSPSSSRRDVFALSKWAEEHGIVMHKSLQWKQYDSADDKDGNWGLELKEPVPRGTTLLQVPRNLVLDADRIRSEFKIRDGAERLQQALQQLGDFGIHEEVFLIFLKLLRCSKDRDSPWTPWIEALPKKFPEFSSAEKECLPFYAKYAADYQDKKFEAFCQASAKLGEYKGTDPRESETLKWACNAVGSRCWKTEPRNEDDVANTELVPVGDMFNHREPPNVAITHDEGCVNFVYKGDADENNKDLYITYGQPHNPHRFLVIFGFVPEDMPFVWSHLAYADNPFSVDASKMVFQTADGMIPKIVWDAVLYALLQPPPGSTPAYTEEQHAKYKKFTSDVLSNHVAKQLAELAELRQKIETTEGENMDMIRRHNEFLTSVFSKVQKNIENTDG